MKGQRLGPPCCRRLLIIDCVGEVVIADWLFGAIMMIAVTVELRVNGYLSSFYILCCHHRNLTFRCLDNLRAAFEMEDDCICVYGRVIFFQLLCRCNINSPTASLSLSVIGGREEWETNKQPRNYQSKLPVFPPTNHSSPLLSSPLL